MCNVMQRVNGLDADERKTGGGLTGASPPGYVRAPGATRRPPQVSSGSSYRHAIVDAHVPCRRRSGPSKRATEWSTFAWNQALKRQRMVPDLLTNRDEEDESDSEREREVAEALFDLANLFGAVAAPKLDPEPQCPHDRQAPAGVSGRGALQPGRRNGTVHPAGPDAGVAGGKVVSPVGGGGGRGVTVHRHHDSAGAAFGPSFSGDSTDQSDDQHDEDHLHDGRHSRRGSGQQGPHHDDRHAKYGAHRDGAPATSPTSTKLQRSSQARQETLIKSEPLHVREGTMISHLPAGSALGPPPGMPLGGYYNAAAAWMAGAVPGAVTAAHHHPAAAAGSHLTPAGAAADGTQPACLRKYARRCPNHVYIARFIEWKQGQTRGSHAHHQVLQPAATTSAAGGSGAAAAAAPEHSEAAEGGALGSGEAGARTPLAPTPTVVPRKVVPSLPPGVVAAASAAATAGNEGGAGGVTPVLKAEWPAVSHAPNGAVGNFEAAASLHMPSVPVSGPVPLPLPQFGAHGRAALPPPGVMAVRSGAPLGPVPPPGALQAAHLAQLQAQLMHPGAAAFFFPPGSAGPVPGAPFVPHSAAFGHLPPGVAAQLFASAPPPFGLPLPQALHMHQLGLHAFNNVHGLKPPAAISSPGEVTDVPAEHAAPGPAQGQTAHMGGPAALPQVVQQST